MVEILERLIPWANESPIPTVRPPASDRRLTRNIEQVSGSMALDQAERFVGIGVDHSPFDFHTTDCLSSMAYHGPGSSVESSQWVIFHVEHYPFSEAAETCYSTNLL